MDEYLVQLNHPPTITMSHEQLSWINSELSRKLVELSLYAKENEDPRRSVYDPEIEAIYADRGKTVADVMMKSRMKPKDR